LGAFWLEMSPADNSGGSGTCVALCENVCVVGSVRTGCVLSVLARFAGGGGGSEVDVRSSVECPISLSVVVALVLMDGVVHVRAVPSDLPAM
jgi:hypothetical protein